MKRRKITQITKKKIRKMKKNEKYLSLKICEEHLSLKLSLTE